MPAPYKFTPGEGYKTRGGKEAKVYAVISHDIHGAIKYSDKWCVQSWFLDGSWATGFPQGDNDLLPKTRRVEGWVNIYRGNNYIATDHLARNFGSVYIKKEEAIKDGVSSTNYVKTIQIITEIED